jgi:YVTN family beta-propeller protein
LYRRDESRPLRRALRLAAELSLLLATALLLLPGSLRAQNVTATLSVGSLPYGVAVNPVTNKIYIASIDAGVSVIDGATNTVTSLTDPNAIAPWAVGVDTVNNVVYVANHGSNNVSVFQGATATTPASLINTVSDSNASSPFAVAVDPISHLAYVANDGSANVTVISGWSYSATVLAGPNPESLAVNPLTHLVYVANRNTSNATGTVTVITPPSGPAVGYTTSTIAAGGQPSSVGILAASNLIFVANLGDGTILEINAATATTTMLTDPNGGAPNSIAVNPVTNQVYVASISSNNVSVISVPGNAISDVNLGTTSDHIAVDVISNTAYVTTVGTGAGVSAINGNTLVSTVVFSAAAGAQSLAVNPVTHRAYVANYVTPGSVTVIDGATNLTSDVPTSVATDATMPNAIAVDPVTNLIFVADHTNNLVQVINGSSDAVTQSVPVGTNPIAMVVDSARGYVYVANHNDNSQISTVIRESDFTTAGIGDNGASHPIGLDLNTVNSTIFVANQDSDSLSWAHLLFDEETTFSSFGVCHQPNAVAVNSVTAQVWVSCNDGNITRVNFSGFNTTTFGLSAPPVAVVLNPLTNQVYVATTTGDIDIIDGVSLAITTVSNGGFPSTAIAVNTASSKVYVLNAAGTVSVLDVANNNALSQVSVGSNPTGIAINPVTNKIYVVNSGGNTITAIDGSSNSTRTINSSGTQPTAIAVNPMTNHDFAFNLVAGDVTDIAEFQPQANGLTVAIQPLTGIGTDTLNQDFNFTVNNTGGIPADQVLYQLDTWQGQWQQATLDSPGQYDGMTTLIPGFHILYAYATAGDEATDTSGGFQSSPVIGTMTAYGFLVAPAMAQFSHEYFNTNFGTQTIGTQSAPQTITLVNFGGAPLNITDTSIVGNNPSDFILNVGGTGPADCSTFGGVLPGGMQCDMSVYFQPQTNFDESAVLTVTDDSGGTPGSQQTQPMTGNGVPQVTITASGAGSGSINDGNVSLYTCTTFPCTASYLGGQQITFTANANNGSVFNGFTGDCSGTAPCTLTMSGSHTFNADFEPAVVNPITYTLTVAELGTGTGTITDGLEPTQLSCTTSAAPALATTCTGTYNSGQRVDLTETPTGSSTFGGWGTGPGVTACTSTGIYNVCPVSMTGNMTASAYFVPPPSMVTLNYNSGAPSNTAYFNCGVSNPSPANPCPNLNAHSINLAVTSVSTAFNLIVVSTEVSPLQADGNCESGNTVGNDFDCRIVSDFSGTDTGGNIQVPQCDAYANGDCVFYSAYVSTDGVTRVEPDPSSYVGPVNWNIAFNNDSNTAPLGYSSSERLYDDPDYEASATTPYGTSCSTAMVTGTPPGTAASPAIYCQFEFDITTSFSQSPIVDRGIGGTTQQFNDVVVAFPLNSTVAPPDLSVTDTADSVGSMVVAANTGVHPLAVPNVSAGGTIGYTAVVSNSTVPGTGTANNVVLTDNLPGNPGLSWSIASSVPAGACSINGSLGSQVLTCQFGNISPVIVATVEVTSVAVAGMILNSVTVTSSNNATITATAAPVTVSPSSTTFSNLTPSPSISYGTASVRLSGTLSSGATHPPSGEPVSVVINNASQMTTTASGGAFSFPTFPTSTIPGSATPYTITYSYAGDGTFGAVTDTSTTLTVNKAGTTTAITSNTPNPSNTGGAVAVAFKVTPTTGGTPTGSVIVTASTLETCTTTLTAGAGTCNITFTTSGPRTLSAAYQGDTNFTTSTSPSVPQTVNSTVSTTTFSTVTASQTISCGTASISLSGTLTSGTTHPPANETVSVTINRITQTTTTTGSGSSGGKFSLTFTTSAIPASVMPYTITYSYPSDSTFGPATNTATTLTVTKIVSTTKITSNSPNPSNTGAAVTIVFTVTGSKGTPAGSVTVTASTLETCTGTLGAGAGSCAITFTTTGTRTLTAAYAGDTNFNTSSSTRVSQVVNSAGGTGGLTISPTSLAFGNVYRGTTPVKMVTLTNNTTSTVTISNIYLAAVAGGDSYDFVGLNLCSKTLAVKKSCQIEMSFVPNTQVKTVQSAILTIVNSAASAPQTVNMTATVIDPEATPSPSSLSFGAQKAKTTSSAKTITVTNTGLTTTTISSVAISGNFALTSAGTCKAATTLTSRAKCTLVVTFTPSAKGSMTGKITLTDDALNSPQTITLSGTGN